MSKSVPSGSFIPSGVKQIAHQSSGLSYCWHDSSWASLIFSMDYARGWFYSPFQTCENYYFDSVHQPLQEFGIGSTVDSYENLLKKPGEETMKSETLKDSEIFRGLDDAQIERLADLCDEESYRRGETIFNQGKKADKLFILMDGAVTLRIRAQKEIDLTATTVEKRGEVFGTAALLKPYRHQVTAQCSKVTNVLSIKGEEFFRMSDRDYRMGFEVMKRVAEIYASRLNSTRSLITSLFKIFRVQTAKSKLIQTYQESE